MVSIYKFRAYLNGVAIIYLISVEKDLVRIPLAENFIHRKWEAIKFSLLRFLNTLYLEMQAFSKSMSSRNSKSQIRKVLIDDLNKDIRLILNLKREILATKVYVNNKESFVLVQRMWLPKIVNLRKVLQDYANDLEMYEGRGRRLFNRLRALLPW